MRAIHKRAERWDGLPFMTLSEAANFIAELEPKLKSEEEVQTSVSVTTEERDFRELTLDELRELSNVLSIHAIQSLIASCGRDEGERVCVNLSLSNHKGSTTELDVQGEEEIVVDGLYIGAKKKIDGCFERIRHAEELAEAKSEPHDGKSSLLDRWEPWLIQIVGGTIATVVGAVVLFLIFR